MSVPNDLRPKIMVIGVGGAGGNAVNNMIRSKLEGVEFIIANTDAQSINQSLVTESGRLQLGPHITQGLGAGSKPDVGRAAAEESIDEVIKRLHGSHMVFITGGMGGGTGTGAAPVIARATREQGMLTVGVVTKPFHFEGNHRARAAEKGIEELQKVVDTLIVIPNQNLFRIANERTTFADAFKMADDVLYSGVKGVTDLMIMPGLINLDFADIRAVMAEMGKAMMGTGEAEGERRALDAAEAAISNPLLDDVSMKGARGVLVNITGGYDMTLYEVDEAANLIRDSADPDANLIFGSTFDEKLDGRMRVSVFASGIGSNQEKEMPNASYPQAATDFRQYRPVTSEQLQTNHFVDFRDQEVAASHDESIQGEAIPDAAHKQAVIDDVAIDHHEDIKEDLLPQDKDPIPAPETNNHQPIAEKKRVSTLFERFTNAGKKTDPSESASNTFDDTDIPSFLRRK